MIDQERRDNTVITSLLGGTNVVHMVGQSLLGRTVVVVVVVVGGSVVAPTASASAPLSSTALSSGHGSMTYTSIACNRFFFDRIVRTDRSDILVFDRLLRSDRFFGRLLSSIDRLLSCCLRLLVAIGCTCFRLLVIIGCTCYTCCLRSNGSIDRFNRLKRTTEVLKK